MSVSCQACGTINESGSTKCAVCGAGLAPAAIGAPPMAPQVAQPAQPKAAQPAATASRPAATQTRPATPAAAPSQPAPVARPAATTQPAQPPVGKGPATAVATAPAATAAAPTPATPSPSAPQPAATAAPAAQPAEGEAPGLTGEIPALQTQPSVEGGWQTHPSYPHDLSTYPWGAQAAMAARAQYQYPYPYPYAAPYAMPPMYPPFGMYGFPPMWGYPYAMPYMPPYGGGPPGYGMSPYGAPGMGPYPGDGYGWRQPRKRMRPWAIVLIVVVVLMVVGGSVAAALLLTGTSKTSFNLGGGTVTGANIEFTSMTLKQNGRNVVLSGTYANNAKREGDVLISVMGISKGAEQVLDFTIPVVAGTKTFTQTQSVSYTLSGATLGSMVFEATGLNNQTYPYQNSSVNIPTSPTTPLTSPSTPTTTPLNQGNTDGSTDLGTDGSFDVNVPVQ